MGLLDFLVVHGNNKIVFGKIQMKEMSALHFEADFSVPRLILSFGEHKVVFRCSEFSKHS